MFGVVVSAEHLLLFILERFFWTDGDDWLRRSLCSISHLRYCGFVQLLLRFDQSLTISLTLLALRDKSFLACQ